MTRFLRTRDLVAIALEADLDAIRDYGLLDAAAQRPRASAFGTDAYPTLDEKVAVLLESVVRNHPLVDGNKRLGWLSTVAFYAINGVRLDAPEDPAYDLVIAVSTGVLEHRESAAMLASWTSTSTS